MKVKKKRKKKLFNLLKLNRLKLIHRLNTLEVQKSALEETIKSELYKEFLNKLREPQEIKRLKKENKNLRLKNKKLKSFLESKG